ncbi:battenin isoform X10 [Struthio camelus]|uniref:battenin isoform X10 n=1 Tax=Struthio camelus TaxID=8801 RepID=UPI00360412DB
MAAAAGGERRPDEEPPEPPGACWRDNAAFWILGLCNNFAYVVMLSAAHDILRRPPAAPQAARHLPHGADANGSRYDCNPVSTGAVLLADILPTLLLKLAAPFGLHLVPYRRGAGQRLLRAGRGDVPGAELLVPQGGGGLVGLGDGGGGAGGGPGLRGADAGRAQPPPGPAAAAGAAPGRAAQGLLKYLVPLAIVYFAEYFINQGLLELLYFPASRLSHAEQYRWYQLLYQGGVFAARSSLRCLRLRRLWPLALLQSLNAALALSAVAAAWLPGPAGAFALVACEGLLGGAAYANAVANVGQQVPPEEGEFAMTVAALGDTVGIALSGAAALPVHGYFCRRS